MSKVNFLVACWYSYMIGMWVITAIPSCTLISPSMTLEYAPNVVSNILQWIKDYTTTTYHIEILQHSLCQARLSPPVPSAFLQVLKPPPGTANTQLTQRATRTTTLQPFASAMETTPPKLLFGECAASHQNNGGTKHWQKHHHCLLNGTHMIRWGLHKPNELGGSTPSLPVPKLFIVVRLCASLLNSGPP